MDTLNERMASQSAVMAVKTTLIVLPARFPPMIADMKGTWYMLAEVPKMINRFIRAYLVKLGFANYYSHFIHGDPARLHWCKKNDPRTVDVLFNTRSGDITIADDVKLGHGVMFLTGLHTFDDGILTNQVPENGRDIVIKSGCWIASRAIILGGVTLEENCKVYAGAIVTKSFPAGSKIKGEKAR